MSKEYADEILMPYATGSPSYAETYSLSVTAHEREALQSSYTERQHCRAIIRQLDEDIPPCRIIDRFLEVLYNSPQSFSMYFPHSKLFYHLLCNITDMQQSQINV
jgi:hypothetical protein